MHIAGACGIESFQRHQGDGIGILAGCSDHTGGMGFAVLTAEQDLPEPLLSPFDQLYHSRPFGAAGEHTQNPAHTEELRDGFVAQHSGKRRPSRDERTIGVEETETSGRAIHQPPELLFGMPESLLDPAPSRHFGPQVGNLLPERDHLVDEILFLSMLISHVLGYEGRVAGVLHHPSPVGMI